MNLELKTTTIGAKTSFLDSEKVRYVRGGITLDHLSVLADPLTGLKRIAAGTVVGRLGNGKYSAYAAGAAAVPGAAALTPAMAKNWPRTSSIVSAAPSEFKAARASSLR